MQQIFDKAEFQGSPASYFLTLGKFMITCILADSRAEGRVQ